ncbi:MAG: hypothetical protein J6039_00335 [Alphaproteobacteria bacterium]|nr:hypothetical protein [Alphaproteobacteria bacterium]
MAKKDKKDNDVAEKTETKETVTKSARSGKGKFFRWLKVLMLLILAGCGAVGYFAWKMQVKTEAVANSEMSCERRLNALESLLEKQSAEISAIKTREALKPKGISEEYLAQNLSELRESLKNEIIGEMSVVPGDDGATMVISAEKQTQEMLLANGAMIIRDLATKGENISYELEVLNILAQGNYPAMKYVNDMRKYATSGIIGKGALISNFNKVYVDLQEKAAENVKKEEPETAEENEPWYKLLKKWVVKFFVARKKSVVPLFSDKDEVWILVNEGNIGEALQTMNLSGKYASVNYEPLQVWKKQAAEYLDFEKAAEGLLLNALAGMHLKELEH